ncbi:MAG: hypothetical protein AAFQ94_07620 [Bacteroidota bacterium]
MKKLLISVAIICLAHYFSNAQTLNESDLPSNGITYQIGPGSNNSTKNWTYPYGIKLSVYEGNQRNFEIMNTHKGATSTLAFRTYDGNSNQWTGWREMLFRDSQKRMRFPVKSFFAPQVSNFDGDLLLQSSNTALVGNYGAALSFSRIAGGVTRRAAIASKQTGTDEDHVGLAFFTHGGIAADDLIESMVIDGNGDVGIGTNDPIGRLDVNLGGWNNIARVSFDQSSDHPSMRLYRPTGSASNPNIAYPWWVENSSQGKLTFKSGSPAVIGAESVTSRVTFLPSGKVGIGTTDPTAKLDVRGGAFWVSNSTNQRLEFTQNTNNQGHGVMNLRSAAGDLKFQMAGADQFVVKRNGRFGIGISNPEEKLHVVGTSSIVGNIGNISDQIWRTGQHTLELQNTDAGDVVLAFHRSGHTSSSIRHTSSGGLTFTANGSHNTTHMYIKSNGFVGIGTSNPDTELAVKGIIHSEEVKVDLNVPGPDYVFEEDYDLISLEETKAYISANKHLPEVPSAKEMEANGINLSDMSMTLLRKIEEMTLHQIELMETVKQQNTQLRSQSNALQLQNAQIEKLQKEIEVLKNQ